MKKITLSFVATLLWVFLQANIALAEEQPHIISTPDCPTGEICCPSKIYCSYKEGCGETGPWLLDASGLLSFEGVHEFNLSHFEADLIWWEKQKNKQYSASCSYEGQHETIGLWNNDGYKLNGNWEYSGFMNAHAICISNNPSECTGKQLSRD